MLERRNLLFICSRNQWRSPTAEALWRRDPHVNVRSAGTSPRARRTVNASDIRWADILFVMENKHRRRLKGMFPQLTARSLIHVLEIPDEYRYMDPELIDLLQVSVGDFLSQLD